MAAIATAPWIEAFDHAVAGIDTGDTEVTVLHRLDDGAAWRITVSGGRARVQAAAADDDADLTFTWQRADAAAVARGELSVLVPFQAGRLRIGGDLTRLAEAAALFANFPPVPGA